MKISFKSVLTGLFVFIVFHLNAQDLMVHGIVTTFDSIPLIGAEVRVKSSKLAAKTDTTGKFVVGCMAGDKLKISAKGFESETIKLKDNTRVVAVNLKLKSGEKAREYAVGYGHVSDKEKLYALANLSEDDMDFSQYENIYDLIKGKVPGVQVVKGNQIIIRGAGSFQLSNTALVVVDGIPYNNSSVLNTIHPTQVKSINVLKGGSATMYGARGSNGVLVIETKAAQGLQ